MRGAVGGLASPHPLIQVLPAIYEGQGLAGRLCAALDEVRAPVESTLDNLPAYLDVRTVPDDMLPWLAAWTGVPLDRQQHPEQHRSLLRQAAELNASQGTVRGIKLGVEAVLGLPCVVTETGASAWSQDAEARLPGEPVAAVAVQVVAPSGVSVDLDELDSLVARMKPAYVRHRVDVVST